ncbi:uncharacterized membrane protein YhaH (DUF805 family) [Bartonella silvatica]|uniref:Uncharacterized membrane protein YhaH (DUF805 family) n=1 Tax=Bartonella silvatica TaxID=357760 RepID=A0ABV2HH37_9HYPH
MQKNQILNKKLHTGESVFSLKKWTAFSRKDYLIVSIISFMMIAVKVYVYIAFWNLIGKSIENQLRIALVSVFVSACVLVTLPVIFILRAIVTFYLNKKLQRLEELKQ